MDFRNKIESFQNIVKVISREITKSIKKNPGFLEGVFEKIETNCFGKELPKKLPNKLPKSFQ